ncbi:protein of unknown function [Bartonella clarridgeiae 73]|uniref:Uncharacterized protein n=1 Tax=Bartonella clarridgeiae (strain CCUG 45776 / CIP 104772 / 73) TaxID=696125 RepID=E6YG15_BARC7|nr:protein of unknown function [Bartonella clarridgeiae 73]
MICLQVGENILKEHDQDIMTLVMESVHIIVSEIVFLFINSVIWVKYYAFC